MTAEILPFAPAFVERRLASALSAEESGEIDRAFEECKMALQAAPQDPRPAALAAVYAALMDRQRAALFYSRKAMKSPPVGQEVAYWCGVARHIAGAHESAIDALDIALTLDPADAAARALRDRCAAYRG